MNIQMDNTLGKKKNMNAIQLTTVRLNINRNELLFVEQTDVKYGNTSTSSVYKSVQIHKTFNH